MKKFVAFLGIVAMVVSLGGTPAPARAATVVSLAQISSGDLIRGQAFPAVYYYGKDGFRYVFPNDKTYFTWYTDFSTVKWISDADLATIQIGGNATYRPGVKMLKINSDPKTYAVGEGGTLRWVTTEAAAVSLYGANWNTKIDDVPDAFFSNYKKGADIEVAGDFNPALETSNAQDMNDDKDLQSPAVVSITDNAYAPTTITIQRNRPVKFLNNGNSSHTATADDLTWGTGTLTHLQHFSRYFKVPGTYTYFCSYHPDMQGTIIVE